MYIYQLGCLVEYCAHLRNDNYNHLSPEEINHQREKRLVDSIKKEQEQDWEKITIEEHMDIYENQGIDHKEAMKKVAADRGVGKREIYAALNIRE